MAQKISIKKARTELTTLIDHVVATKKTVIIKRKRDDVALIDAKELSSILETLHVLGSPKNAIRLFQAYEDAKDRSNPTWSHSRSNRFVKNSALLNLELA